MKESIWMRLRKQVRIKCIYLINGLKTMALGCEAHKLDKLQSILPSIIMAVEPLVRFYQDSDEAMHWIAFWPCDWGK